MTATRTPYETLINEADAICQRARAAAEFAAQVDRLTANLFSASADRAELASRHMRRKLLELDKAAGGETP